MNNNDPLNDNGNPIDELDILLNQKKEEYRINRKAAMWYNSDCNRFFSIQISPVFKDIIIKKLKILKHLDVTYKEYQRVCRLTIRSKLDVFIFKVIVDNSSKSVVFLHEINYKHKPRHQFIKIKDLDTEKVSFNIVNTITKDFVVALFTKWYKAKDEQIDRIKNK